VVLAQIIAEILVLRPFSAAEDMAQGELAMLPPLLLPRTVLFSLSGEQHALASD
jgi:hypothetical protein